MGMTDCTAGKWSEVFEKHHRLIDFGVDHSEPMPQSKAHELAHMLLRIIWNITVALVCFNKYQLIGWHHNIVFIFEENDIALFGHNASKSLCVAKRAAVALIGHSLKGTGLAAAYRHIKIN